MSGLEGRYLVDLQASGRLMAGSFHDRFVMKEGYDEAVARFMEDNAEAVAGTSLTITEAALILRSEEDEDEDEMPIVRRSTRDGKPSIVVDMDGGEWEFEVQSIGDAVRLFCEGHELSDWAWRRA